jgi:hypothetical protein
VELVDDVAEHDLDMGRVYDTLVALLMRYYRKQNSGARASA